MTDLEQRLRSELRQVAENFDPASVRPLRVPERRRRPGLVRWLAPVMAMAAVTGVIVGVHLATAPGGPPPGLLQGAVPGAAKAEPAGPMPSYYVTVFQMYGQAISTTAVVHDSATGAALATVPVPTLASNQGSVTGPWITAAADDRTFVITETAIDTTASQSQLTSGDLSRVRTWNVARFYELSVTAGGHSATLRRLPVSLPQTFLVDAVALSPDGRRLAIAGRDCQGSSPRRDTGIRIITLATGVVSSWTTRAPGLWNAGNLSWAGGGHLAFGWHGPRVPVSYRLLNVAGAGGNLLAAPAIASPAPVAVGQEYAPFAVVTPDGRAVIASAFQNIPEGDGREMVVLSLVETSASTGRQLRVLYTVTVRGVSTDPNAGNGEPAVDQSCHVLSMGPAGVQPLVACPAFGRVENGKLKKLPGFPSPALSGISGQQAAAW